MKYLTAIALFASGCGPQTLDLYETCDLDLSLEQRSGAPGDSIVVLGGPLTADFDTRVEVGGVPAQVIELNRGDFCGACETCRVEAECLVCGPCLGTALDEDRRVECFGDPFVDADITRLDNGTDDTSVLDTGTPATGGLCGACEEQLTFLVPVLPAGRTDVLIVNSNGSSTPLAFQVLLPLDTAATGDTAGTGDTSSRATTADTGPIDQTGDTGTDTDDTGPSDTGDTFGTGDTAATGDTGLAGDTAATGDTGS